MNYKEYVEILKRKINGHQNNLIFVCIGKSEIIWDSIGPKVGSYLNTLIGKKYVIGDMKNNICSKRDLILKQNIIKNKFVIAIDAAFSDFVLNDEIFINNKPIIMGQGVDNNKGDIGDIGIKVCISTPKIPYINSDYVNSISKFVAKGIYDARYIISTHHIF